MKKESSFSISNDKNSIYISFPLENEIDFHRNSSSVRFRMEPFRFFDEIKEKHRFFRRFSSNTRTKILSYPLKVPSEMEG